MKVHVCKSSLSTISRDGLLFPSYPLPQLKLKLTVQLTHRKSIQRCFRNSFGVFGHFLQQNVTQDLIITPRCF